MFNTDESLRTFFHPVLFSLVEGENWWLGHNLAGAMSYHSIVEKALNWPAGEMDNYPYNNNKAFLGGITELNEWMNRKKMLSSM